MSLLISSTFLAELRLFSLLNLCSISVSKNNCITESFEEFLGYSYVPSLKTLTKIWELVFFLKYSLLLGFLGGSLPPNNLPANVGVMCSIPGLGISPGEGNGSSLQYFCLGIPMGRGAWWAIVHGVTEKSDTT